MKPRSAGHLYVGHHRTRPRMAFRDLSLLFGLLCFCQVSASQETLSRWKETTDRAYAVQDAAETYVKGLKLDGIAGRSALNKLLGDGFMCGLTSVRKNDPPLLFCTKSSPPIPDCAALDMYLFLSWKGEDKNFQTLVAELDTANIKSTEPVCRLRLKK